MSVPLTGPGAGGAPLQYSQQAAGYMAQQPGGNGAYPQPGGPIPDHQLPNL